MVQTIHHAPTPPIPSAGPTIVPKRDHRRRKLVAASKTFAATTVKPERLLPANRQFLFNTDKMGGVTVKDIESHTFVKAYAAFLKRQGKLPM